MFFRDLVEGLARYPATVAVLCGYLGLIIVKRRSGRAVRRVAPAAPSDATWFVPVYVWGIESTAHAHWWAFRAPWKGIAPNLLWIGVEQAFSSAGMLALVCIACFIAEREAWKCGMRARRPQATLPISAVAGILAVVEAWSLLIWAMAPGFMPYAGSR